MGTSVVHLFFINNPIKNIEEMVAYVLKRKIRIFLRVFFRIDAFFRIEALFKLHFSKF